MKIRLKLYASLRDLLPAGTSHEGVEFELPEDATPQQVMAQYRVPPKMAHLVLRNGVFLNPEERERPVLQDGDVLAVWPPIAGG